MNQDVEEIIADNRRLVKALQRIQEGAKDAYKFVESDQKSNAMLTLGNVIGLAEGICILYEPDEATDGPTPPVLVRKEVGDEPKGALGKVWDGLKG